MIAIEILIRINQTLMKFFNQTLMRKISADLAYEKLTRFVWSGNPGNWLSSKTNQNFHADLAEIILSRPWLICFQSNPDENFLIRLCLKFFKRDRDRDWNDDPDQLDLVWNFFTGLWLRNVKLMKMRRGTRAKRLTGFALRTYLYETVIKSLAQARPDEASRRLPT